MRLWKTLLTVLTATTLVGLVAACGSADPTATPTRAATTQVTAPTPTSSSAVVAPTPTPVTKLAGDLAGSGEAMEKMTEKPEYGGVINWGRGAVRQGVDPYSIVGYQDYIFFNSLVEQTHPYDPGLGVQYEPGVAAEWTQSEDGTKWVFKLRPGIIWHDGEAFTADDVVATVSRMLDTEVTIATRQVPMRQIFVGATKVDDLTVTLDTGEKPNATAFAFIANHRFLMTPQHLITGDLTSADAEKRWLFMHPDNTGTFGVGTGPFKMTTWNADVELIGERNANYFKFDEFGNQLPYADGWTHTAVSNPTRQLARFVAGIDDYTIGVGAGMNPKEASALCKQTRAPGCSIQEFPHGYFAWFTNFLQIPAFKEGKVNAAARYSNDMDEILRISYGGRQGFMVMDRGRYPDTALSLKEQYELVPWSDPARRPEFVQKAKDLMTESGFPDGIDLPFPIFSNGLCTGSFLDEYSRHVDQFHRVGLRSFLECRQGVDLRDELRAGRWSMNGPGGSIWLLDPGYSLILWHLLDSGPLRNDIWRYPGQDTIDAKFRVLQGTSDEAVRNEQYKDIERFMTDPELTSFATGFTVVHLAKHGCMHNYSPGGTWDSHLWSQTRTWLSGECRNDG